MMCSPPRRSAQGRESARSLIDERTQRRAEAGRYAGFGGAQRGGSSPEACAASATAMSRVMHIDTILRRRVPAVLHARPESRCIQTRSKVWAVSLTAVLGPSHPGLMWSQQETPETTRELSVELSTHMPISRQHRLLRARTCTPGNGPDHALRAGTEMMDQQGTALHRWRIAVAGLFLQMALGAAALGPVGAQRRPRARSNEGAGCGTAMSETRGPDRR